MYRVCGAKCKSGSLIGSYCMNPISNGEVNCYRHKDYPVDGERYIAPTAEEESKP